MIFLRMASLPTAVNQNQINNYLNVRVTASRADEEQLPAAAQQVCERRALVGALCGRGARAALGWQEGRSAPEGHALVVGPYGVPSAPAPPATTGAAASRRASRCAASVTRPPPRALRHGPAARARPSGLTTFPS